MIIHVKPDIIFQPRRNQIRTGIPALRPPSWRSEQISMNLSAVLEEIYVALIRQQEVNFAE